MQQKLLHILRRHCASFFVLMSHLRKLCDCCKSSNKKAAYLIVPFKSYKVNPNASAGPCGSKEMHLWSEVLKCDKHDCKLKLQQEDAILLQHTADTSCNAEQNLNQQLWLGVTFLCNFRFLDLLTRILSATSQSSNKIHI